MAKTSAKRKRKASEPAPATQRDKDAAVVRRLARKCIMACVEEAEKYEVSLGDEEDNESMVNMLLDDAKRWTEVYKFLFIAKNLTAEDAAGNLNEALNLMEEMDTACGEMPWVLATSDRMRDQVQRFFDDSYNCQCCGDMLSTKKEFEEEVCKPCLASDF